MCKYMWSSIKFIALVYAILALFGFFAWYNFFYQNVRLFFQGFEVFLNIILSMVLWGILNIKIVKGWEVRLNNPREMLNIIKESKAQLFLAVLLYVSALLVYDKTNLVRSINNIIYQHIEFSEQSVALLNLILIDNLMISRVFAVYLGIYFLNILCGNKVGS